MNARLFLPRQVCRPLQKFLTLWCILVSSALAQAPSASGSPHDPAYLTALQARAQTQRLAQAPYWHTLVHYERQPLTRRLRSLADDPDFFNAGPAGRTDPAAELQATLAALFDPAQRRAGRALPIPGTLGLAARTAGD
jgi:hypothetical protein